MNILNISTVDLDKNGISTFILNYSEKIISKDVYVDIVSPNHIDSERKRYIEENIGDIYELPCRKSNPIKYFYRLFKLIKKNKYDIVHIHGNSCTMAIELIAAMFGKCKVRIAHSHNTTCSHKVINRILRPFFYIACNSRMACGEDAGKWLFRNKKYTIINNCVDLSKYKYDLQKREKIRKKLNLREEILIGHVGEFNDAKNQIFLINLIDKLNSISKIRYKLILIGDGINFNKVRNITEEKGLLSNVIFTGAVNNVNDYLNGFDIFVMPSKFEGLPFVLIEAQAVGLKCIASDMITREANITNRVEYVPLDINKWVDIIINISLDNRKNYNFNEKYDLEKNAIRLISIYKELLNKNI